MKSAILVACVSFCVRAWAVSDLSRSQHPLDLAMAEGLDIFGRSQPWNSSDVEWSTVDDRVRGGSSRSSLTISEDNLACFSGILDTSTLGGAGFASQSTSRKQSWDLSNFDGVEITATQIDSKVYTFILKDQLPESLRNDGRQKAVISWEYNFNQEGDAGKTFRARWSDFKPTFRGKPANSSKPLDLTSIRGMSLMMRSYFDNQNGSFAAVLESIRAVPKAKL